MLDETPASAEPEKHSDRRVEALITSAEKYIALHADDVAPGIGSFEVGLIRSLINALMRTDRPTPPADDVREPTDAEVTAGVRAILGGATKEAEQSMAHNVRVILRAAFKVRPRGTVTDAEVEAAELVLTGAADGDPWVEFEPGVVRAALEAAREAQR